MNGPVGLELHDTVTLGKKGVIIPDADKLPGTVTRTTLSDNNASRADFLPPKSFNPKPFGL